MTAEENEAEIERLAKEWNDLMRDTILDHAKRIEQLEEQLVRAKREQFQWNINESIRLAHEYVKEGDHERADRHLELARRSLSRLLKLAEDDRKATGFRFGREGCEPIFQKPHEKDRTGNQ